MTLFLCLLYTMMSAKESESGDPGPATWCITPDLGVGAAVAPSLHFYNNILYLASLLAP